jgi:large subunit ribosomal protein L33
MGTRPALTDRDVALLRPPSASPIQVRAKQTLDRKGRVEQFPRFTGREHVRAVSRISLMAKSNTVQIKLVSTADTGFFYVTKKNARAQTTKLELNKYDPVVRKHVPFKEAKIK